MIRFPSRATEKTQTQRSMDSAQDTTTTTNQSLKRSKSKAKLKQQHQADGSISSINRRRANSESSTPRRSQSKKEKINAVSKASLAMLDPRHAMGMDSEFGQHSYSSQDDEEEEERQRERERQLEQYDGIWRENNNNSNGDSTINHAGRGVSKKNAASALPKWSDQKIDPAWQMSPTPTLEAFATGNNFDSDSPSPCSPSLGQLISSNHQPMILQEQESIESSPFEMDDKPQQFVSVFEDDQENNNTLQRQGTLSRVMLRSGSDQSSDSNIKHRTNKSSHKNGSSSSISFVEPSFNNKTKSRKSSFPNVPNNPSLPANSSSIARFFSWKRTNKDKNLPSPLVLNTSRNPLDHSEYPYAGASSAPPNVTTFEDAARKANINNNSGSAPANVTTFEEAEAKARTNGKDSNREMDNFSSLFGHGITSTSFAPTLEARPQWEALDMDQAFKSASQGTYGGEGFNNGQEQVGKRISTLGRKHSLPTMSEQDRASRLSIWIPPPTHSTANFNFGSPSSRNQSHSGEENLNASPTKSPVAALPVLPAIPICSNSPTLFATPAWEASLSRFMDEPSSPSSWSISTGTSGKSLSRVSTLGRGVPNRKSLFEPTEPMPTSKNGKQSSPTKETQRSPRRADSDPSEATKAKVLRRVSRSVGSFNAPPPPLSSFGSPPTFFSPNVPDVPTFLDGNMTSSPSMVSSPSLGFGRGRGNFQAFENPSLGGGMGRGRGRGLWNGTPTQRSVSTFTPVVTHQQPLVHKDNVSLGEEGLSTDLARNLSITSSNFGTSKLGHSPSDSTDSMASITASSEVHLSTQQARRVNLQQAGRAVPVGVASPSLVRSPRTALTKTLASDLVVTVMPPTPDLRIASSPQDQFPGRNQGQGDEDEEECLDDAYGEGMTSEVAQDIERSFSPISSPVKESKSPMRSPGSWRRRDTVIIDGPENIRSPLGLQLEMQSVSGVLPLIQDQDAELYSLPYMEAKGDANDAGLGLDLGMEAIMRRRVDSHSSLRSDASASTGSGEPFGFSRSLSSMSLASDASSLGGSASSGTFSNVGSSTTDLTSPAKSFKSESSYRRDIGNEDNSEDLPPLVPMLKFGSDKSIHEKASSQNSSPNRETSPSAPSNNFLGVGLPSRAHNLSTSSISSALSGITASTSILNLEEDQELEAEKFAKEQGLFSHRSRLQQDSQAQQGPLRTAFPFNKFAVQSPISNNNQELNEDDCETPKIGSGSDTSSPFSQPRTSPIEETESELRSAIAELPATWLANPQSQSSPALRKAAPPKPPKSRARSNSIYQNPSINLQVEVSSGIEAVSAPVSRALRPLALVQQAQGKKDEIIETTRPLFIKRPQPRIVNHNVNRGKENNDPSLVKRRSAHYVNQLASPLSTSTSSRFANNYNSPSSSPRIGGTKSTTSTPSPPLSGLGIGLGFDFGGNSPQNDQVQRSPSWRSDVSNEWMGVAM